MIKYIQITIVLFCFNVNGQDVTLLDKGDSSIYLIKVNDTLSYISFADPENINKGFYDSTFYSNTEHLEYILLAFPARSYLLLTRRIENDTVIFRETYEKYYLNTTVDYSVIDGGSKKQLYISIQGKRFIGNNGPCSFEDSLFVEIDNKIYLGDLNTTTFHFDIPKPKKKSFDVKIYSESGRIDFTIAAKIKKNTSGLIIKYELLENELHSFMVNDYLKNIIPINIMTEDENHQIKFEFINWWNYYKTNEIEYY